MCTEYKIDVLYFSPSSAENIICSDKYFVNSFQEIRTNVFRSTCKVVIKMRKWKLKWSCSFS